MTTADARRAAARAAFFVRPLRQAPRLEPHKPSSDAVLGRSHRAKAGKAKLKRAIDLTREVLQVPADYRIGIVPASDTGAVEMALWSLLGAAAGRRAGLGSLRRRLGDRRRQAAQAQGRARAGRAATASCPISPAVDPAHDVVFTWNGTTSGVRVPNADWIAADRTGLDDLRRHLGRVRACRSTGTSSMSSPSPGRRCWAARRRTAC